MNFRKSAFIVLAAVLTAPFASAAEAAWPKNSAGDLSSFLALLRFRIQADHCSAKVPQSRKEFESLIDSLDKRIQGISEGLLASEKFSDMKDKPVPDKIIDSLKDSFDDTKHNFERRDAASVCPKTLQSLGKVDDESLKSGLTEILTAVQNMVRNLEKDSGRQAPP